MSKTSLHNSLANLSIDSLSDSERKSQGAGNVSKNQIKVNE
jgi:hypothetical protein